MTDQMLNLGAWEERSRANGPGVRFVLWMQGCSLHCPGCINPEFWSFEPAQKLTVKEMAERILSVDGIEGVTYSGGEPSFQAKALLELSQLLKTNGLTVVSYSGFTLDELMHSTDPEVPAWLATLDMLIDGPYQRSNAKATLWRGSSNQRVHFFSDAYRHLANQVERSQQVVELIAGNDHWKLVGIWQAEFQERLKHVMEQEKPHD